MFWEEDLDKDNWHHNGFLVQEDGNAMMTYRSNNLIISVSYLLCLIDYLQISFDFLIWNKLKYQTQK